MTSNHIGRHDTSIVEFYLRVPDGVTLRAGSQVIGPDDVVYKIYRNTWLRRLWMHVVAHLINMFRMEQVRTYIQAKGRLVLAESEPCSPSTGEPPKTIIEVLDRSLL